MPQSFEEYLQSTLKSAQDGVECLTQAKKLRGPDQVEFLNAALMALRIAVAMTSELISPIYPGETYAPVHQGHTPTDAG